MSNPVPTSRRVTAHDLYMAHHLSYPNAAVLLESAPIQQPAVRQVAA